jgi:hypothetical protein
LPRRESAGATGKSSIKPLGTAATAVIGIGFLRAIGVVPCVDGQHSAANLAGKIVGTNLKQFPQPQKKVRRPRIVLATAGRRPKAKFDPKRA